MPPGAIMRINAAEEEARQAKILIQQKAKEAIEAVEEAGKASVQAALARAEAEIADLIHAADQTAAEQAIQLAASTANKQAALRVRAKNRFKRTSRLILERIVNI